MSNDQVVKLMDKSQCNVIYLPPKKLHFKGLKIKNSLFLVGNNEATVMMKGQGFNFFKSIEEKIIKFSELNARSLELESLFWFEEDKFEIYIQNSLLQNMSEAGRKVRFINSVSTLPKNIKIVIKNSIIQNF